MNEPVTMLVQRYSEDSGDYRSGAIRIAIVTPSPDGRCSLCGCPLYASVIFDTSGTAIARDMGQHRKHCENRSRFPVVRRRVAGV